MCMQVAKAVSHSLNNCVNCLPGQKDVDVALKSIGEASKNLNGMIRMNETGAFFWKELENGITEEELVGKMLERFEDLDEETAHKDLREYLETMEIALEREEGE